MVELVQLWFLVECLGILSLPLTITVFRNLPDRGFTFTKAIGILVLAFAVWFPLNILPVLPFERWMIIAILALLSVGYLWEWIRLRHKIWKFVRLNFVYVTVVEVLFLALIIFLGILRAYKPDIQGFESFMDEALIASIMRSPHMPPNDMWFSGSSINYYYYAHYTLALLAKILGQPASVAFNTGISLCFALTGIHLFGVTVNVVAWGRYLRKKNKQDGHLANLENPSEVHPPLLGALPFGFVSIFMGLIMGNLAATQQWWDAHNNGVSGAFNWFDPSRVVTGTINEFPAFSFLLSCFHAHVITLAFTVLALGLAFNLFLEAKGKGIALFGKSWLQRGLTLAVTSLVLGGLFVMNGWDLPSYLGFTLICIVMQQWFAHDRRFSLDWLLNTLVLIFTLIVFSLLFFLPFYLTYKFPTGGFVFLGAEDRSDFRQELLIYGIFGFIFLTLLLVSVLQSPFRLRASAEEDEVNHRGWLSPHMWAAVGIAFLFLVDLVLFSLSPQNITLGVMINLVGIGVIMVFLHPGDRSHVFTLLVGVTAFFLVALCEVVLLKDVFYDQPIKRMNTIFKFYFQAWTLLSIGSGCGLYYIIQNFMPQKEFAKFFRWIQPAVGAVWMLMFLFFCVLGLAYPLLAPGPRLSRIDYQTGKTYWQMQSNLDGMEYMKDCQPPNCDYLFNSDYVARGDYEAIHWLNENVQGAPVIAEAVGDSYSSYGRVSVFTGLPDVVNWLGHERQWRTQSVTQMAELSQRQIDVETLYSTADQSQIETILARYNVSYLYVGPLEYQKYGALPLIVSQYRSFMDVVYDTQGVTIFHVRKA